MFVLINESPYRYACPIALIVFSMTFISCSDTPTNSDENSNKAEGFTIEGTMDGYDLGEQKLYNKEDFNDLIEGTVGEDGSLAVTFLGIEEIEDALKPIGDDSFDDFVGIYCREQFSEQIDPDVRFAGVNVMNFTYGDDHDVAMIGLSSDKPNNNVYPPQSDHRGTYHVRWIFSSESITLDEECGNRVDLDLNEGWNEVIFDLSDSQNKLLYTGERPAAVDWVLEQ